MIPPRDELPRKWKDLANLTFDFPRLNPDSPVGCPSSQEQILEYLNYEAPGGEESGSEIVTEFELKFVRSAFTNGSRCWLWSFNDGRGTDCFVVIWHAPNGDILTSYDEAYGLSPEQWLVLDYYAEEDWEN